MIAPVGIVSTGWPQVRDTCARLGWRFDRWQDGAGRLILAKGADGVYAADMVVISIPRQVGKTYLIGCIVFALCMIQPGLTVVWTAHRKTTAVETFGKMEGMAKRPSVWPHILATPRGKGNEAILFRNGSRILFGARESGFGRGFDDVDVIVADEGQIMTEVFMEDIAATQNVAANPLMFMMGTPPRPKDPGEVFTLMRQEAIDGESDDTLYIELSADRGCDPMDRGQWRQANPSFPHRTSERALLRLRKKLKSDDSWNREALGIWDEVSRHRPVVSAAAWRDMVDIGPADGERPISVGVDMSHGMEISVAGCWIEESSAHIEELWAGSDVAKAIDWIATAAGRRSEVLIDDIGPAAQMVPALKARNVKVRRTTARDMGKGCLLFETHAKAEKLTHGNQDSLTAAVLGARKRLIADAGGWGWDRSDPTKPIHPVVAGTLALLGATESHKPRPTTKRRSRKAVIG